jgi:ankyrin repeat protein
MSTSFTREIREAFLYKTCLSHFPKIVKPNQKIAARVGNLFLGLAELPPGAGQLLAIGEVIVRKIKNPEPVAAISDAIFNENLHPQVYINPFFNPQTVKEEGPSSSPSDNSLNKEKDVFFNENPFFNQKIPPINLSQTSSDEPSTSSPSDNSSKEEDLNQTIITEILKASSCSKPYVNNFRNLPSLAKNEPQNTDLQEAHILHPKHLYRLSLCQDLFYALKRNKAVQAKRLINLLTVEELCLPLGEEFLTPLQLAAAKGNLEIVTLLVNRKVKAKVLNSDRIAPAFDFGIHPLELAARCNHIQVARYLLLHGCEVNILDFLDKCSLEMKMLFISFESDEEMLKHYLKHAYEIDNADLFKYVLRNEGNFEKTFFINSDDFFHLTILKNKLNLAQMCLQLGAQINQRDIEGNTALHLKVREAPDVDEEDIRTIHWLIDHHADCTIENDAGISAFALLETSYVEYRKLSEEMFAILNKMADS